MIYTPEIGNKNLTNPYAGTYNANDFSGGTDEFVENYKDAKKYGNWKGPKNGDEDNSQNDYDS